MARLSPGRDLIVAGAAVGLGLLVLWAYTGVWPPMVVVESNSMMNVDQDAYRARSGNTRDEGVPYGRLGTIDPGDLILVKDIDDYEDIDLWVEDVGGHYHNPGDVIIYYPQLDGAGNGQGTPIIHRAITFVDVREAGGSRSYVVQWSPEWPEPSGASCTRAPEYTCTFGDAGVTIPSIGMHGRRLQNTGILTKGDNGATNPQADQVALGTVIDRPIRIQQIQGVARGEIPWFGLIKLAVTGGTIKNAEMSSHDDFLTVLNVAAPKDLWVMLVASLVVLTLAPMAVDALLNWRGGGGVRTSEFHVLEDDA